MRAHCARSLSLYALLIIVSGEEESCYLRRFSFSFGFHFCSRHAPHAAVLDEETRPPCETHLLKAFTHAMHAVAQALGLGLLSFNTSNQQSTSKHTTYTQPYTIIRKYDTTGTFRGYAHIKKSNAMKNLNNLGLK